MTDVRQPSAAQTAGECPQEASTLHASLALRLALCVVFGVTVVAFAGVLGNEFVGWDDQQNLIHNVHYRGLSLQHLRWMFTTGFGGHYQPLSWLSFAIDIRFWGGINPAGVHFTNLVLHLATSFGFFFVTRRLLQHALGDVGVWSVELGALVATLLFAVHPLRVESVAWATERRDVLSGAWLMSATALYVSTTATAGTHLHRMRLTVCLVSYMLSLLAKASGMTWPVVLFLLDVYPLHRWSALSQRARRRVVWEKLVFAIPAAGTAGLALWAQADAGALRSLTEHPIGLRIGQAFHSLMFYLLKTVWPVGLVPLYEQRPEGGALDAANVLSAVGVAGFAAVFWKLRRRYPALLTAGALYGVIVSPVLGFAQSGAQVAADRYSYLACMPWAVLAGGAFAQAWANTSLTDRLRRAALLCTALVVIGVLVLATRRQTRMWADSYTLWTTTIERAPDTPIAHLNLAVVLNDRGEYERAKEHSLYALSRLPSNRTAHLALARAALELGDLATAERHNEIALRISEALGKPDASTMVGLAIVQTRLGRPDDAEQAYRAAIAAEPDVAEWRYDLAGFLASRGRFDEAQRYLEEVLRLEPARVEAYSRLGVVQINRGDPAAAISAWGEGLQRAPRDVNLRAQLAWVLATCRVDSLRDGRRGLELAKGAVEDSKRTSVKAFESLSAAQAETGDFAAAAATLETALADKNLVTSDAIALRLQSQLARYRGHQRTRE